ncbi:MAG: translocation/assembly module TamB [Cyclobacteriaceae bacterium]|nr:translocation/assembly module TamB [Cyclobacteriaceae bacterium]
MSWRDLLRGRVAGDFLVIRNVTIQQTITEPKTNIEESQASEKLSGIRFKNIMVSDLRFSQNNSGDTIHLTVPELNIVNMELGDTWHIDSLKNIGSKLDWILQSTAVKEEGTSPSGFTLKSIPEFSIDHLSFVYCDFNIRTSSQQHSVTDFNLNLTGLKQNDLLNMAVDKFSFRYQDTLAVDLSLRRILVNNREEAKISNINFDFPWLTLHIPELDFSNADSPKVSAHFQDCSVNTALIMLFNPSFKLPIAHDLTIHFNGGMSFFKNRFEFDQFIFNPTKNSSLMLSGFADLPGKSGAGVQLNMVQFHASTKEFSELFNFKQAANQREIEINSTMAIMGAYENLKAAGKLSLNKITSTIVAAIDQRDINRISVSVNLKSPLVDPDQLIDSAGVDLALTNFSLSGQATFDKNHNLANLSTYITSDSLFMNGFQVADPTIKLQFTSKGSSADIFVQDVFMLSLNSTDDIFGNNISYKGSIKSNVPQPSNFNLKAGDFYSRVNGKFLKTKSSFDFNLSLDSVRFKLTDYDHIYHATVNLKAGKESTGDLHLDLSMNDKELFHFASTEDIYAWWEKSDKWQGNYPVTELDLSLNVDSLLVRQFTGQKGSLDLKNLHLFAEGDEIKATINIPTFFIDTIGVRDFKGSIESRSHKLNSELTVSYFQNPYTLLENIKILVAQKDEKTLGITMSSFLPEIQNTIDLSSLVVVSDTSLVINLDDDVLHLGNQSWQNADSRGFVFDSDLDLISGDLTVTNGHQKINIETVADVMSLRIDSLDLDPLVQLITNDSMFRGALKMSATYQMAEEVFTWSGAVSGIEAKDKRLGTMRFEGLKSEKALSAHLALAEEFGKIDISVAKDENPLDYRIDIDNLDVGFISSAFSPWKSEIPISGHLNAKVKGSYDDQLTSDGYISFTNVETYFGASKIYLKADRDTLWLTNENLMVNDFRLFDKRGNSLSLNGEVALHTDPTMDMTITTKEFRVLDAATGSTNLKGTIDIASNLQLKRSPNQFQISGTLTTLPNSNVNYLFESSVTLDEREKEITFTSFEDLDKQITISETVIRRTKNSKPIEWDVNLNIGKSDITIVLSEAYQDQIKMTAEGSFLLKTGSTNEPFFFGTLRSREGAIIYDAPMVSDLNFKIDNLLVNWNGELSHPRVTFLGSELFRITPKGIPGMSTATGVVPITVLAKVEDRPIEDFKLGFDLNSTNAQVKSWINSLPADSREASAINLLLFGTLNFGETTSSSYMQGLVSKMNEISRRNIKNADLSFYVDSHNVADSKEKADLLGYSFSKGILNKKMKVTIGGSLDFTGSNSSNQKKSTGLGSVQLDYIISTNPDIAVNLGQKSTYDGAINGQVAQSSVGITYLKRFQNFFKSIKKVDAK